MNTKLMPLLATLLLVGCVNPTTQQSLETKAYAVTRLVIKKTLQKHPDWQSQIAIARDDLKVLQSAEVIGLPEIMAILDRLPPGALGDDDAALYIETGILFFMDELGTIAVKKPEQLRFAVNGMVKALDQLVP